MKTRFFMDFPLFRVSQVLSRFCLVLQPQKVLCRCVQNIPVQMSTIQNSDDDVWVRRGSHCNIFPRRYTCQHMWKNPIFPWFHDNPGFDLCVCVWGGCLGCRSQEFAQSTANSVTPQPTSISVFECREELCSHEDVERICKISNSERCSRLHHTASNSHGKIGKT